MRDSLSANYSSIYGSGITVPGDGLGDRTATWNVIFQFLDTAHVRIVLIEGSTCG